MDQQQESVGIDGLNLAASLDDSGIAVLAGIGERHRVGRGEPVVAKGEEGDSLYGVLCGTVIVTAQDGRLVSVMGPGDTLGEIRFLTGSPRTADAVAQSDAELLRLPGEAVRTLIGSHPEIAAPLYANIAQELARRLTTTTQMALL